ncbi:class I SAM-dependent methyltransferase [Cellulomonas wangsupingiae]|uniref:Class I SAM-dependent methyltransferase n=1 Tax=Cellulomonas wangsupingiae TaxID=2968085 RepID=A0ABY5K4H8_9CELL|nr:methyltransferase domain-containing protein [Cellulomonas wangsupingiae]MCC2336695.1 class I SAM-dependent methyltransferase [Cellulomonas wangsupingiae]MCM0641455.1 class I SAM-dependent methyltransferase [Cellulomonas wangsupingiae]UUI63816.1 class I SAM-dependent methyltransferase [Cellulomonas wangsupingiae]
MVDPMHFEEHADVYRTARPPYPPALWDRVLLLVAPGTRVLDLGAGTGEATGPLLAAGARVTAVEPGPRLAARLAATHPAATVLVTRAEEVELPAGGVDVAVAATAVHWFDLGIVLPRLHRALAPGGRFLVWRHVFGDPDVTTPFRERIGQVVAARSGPGRPGPDAQDAAAVARALTDGGWFALEDTATFRWRTDLDAEQVRALFSTFSDWSPAEVDQASAAVTELGGRVTEHYRSWLLVLRATR